jgi:hypothetical protein
MPLFVLKMKVGDLDKSKCSPKFLSHNLADDVIVNVSSNVSNNSFVQTLIIGNNDLNGSNNIVLSNVSKNFFNLSFVTVI